MSTPAGGRARRKTAKVVDYAKEQDFSDDDIFEDEAEEEKTPRATKSRGRGRPRKTSVEADDAMAEDDELDYAPAKPVYVEKGYDPTLLPLRERFTFMPEYEADGFPKIDLIVGRRPLEEKSALGGANNEDEEKSDDQEKDSLDEDSSDDGGGSMRKSRRGKRRKSKTSSPAKSVAAPQHVEYEYLVKYKGRSYLHLEWKSGADLESMNKSAKALYRRFLKKIATGTEDDLEDPNFDPSFAEPQKIVDEAEQEITVELTDKELVEWEKEREKALAEEEAEADSKDVAIDGMDEAEEKKEDSTKEEIAPDEKANEEGEEAKEEEPVDMTNLTLENLRKIIAKDDPYYPVFEDSENPYSDGYITTPPKKPRASYLFFQGCMRSYYQKENPDANHGELMTILGDAWRAMSEEEQAPFIQLAREEGEQYEKERAMMEKAQKPSEMWQPMRRCLKVLDRLEADHFTDIFLEPVDLDDFPDYEDTIDQPMDLGTVRKKLADRKYQAPENFARDVRKVWNNCKIYNQHGSAIWHVADYMSKQFERLYHAWVLEFRERYLRWVTPKARPWEHSCRQCDGKCGTPDDKMVLCDHCDAMYGMECLKPPLTTLPQGIWHCPDCKPKLATVKGVRMLSAVSEHAARKRAELGDTPKKTLKRKMYLVKWAGLGYEFCTWETPEDIDDDALIAEYHELNNTTPDEPELAEEELSKVLDNTEHINSRNAGGLSCIPDLRSQLYAQTRAFQFSKFGLELPQNLSGECGPSTKAIVLTPDNSQPPSPTSSSPPQHPNEVVECVAEMVFRVARHPSQQLMKINTSLPPLLTGEYDAVVPITSKGLMMNVGEIHGSVAFLGYRSFPDGTKGPAELKNLIRNVGDKIISVDGVSTINKTFKEVILLLRESGKNKFAFMRFLENKYAVCSNDLTSVGTTGKYAVEELKRKFGGERCRVLAQRREQVATEEDVKDDKDESDDSVGPRNSSDEEESDDEGSEGSFEPDSEDEEIVIKRDDPVFKEPETKHAQAGPTPSVPGSSEAPAPNTNGEVTDTDKANSPSKSNEAKASPVAKENNVPAVDQGVAVQTENVEKTADADAATSSLARAAGEAISNESTEVPDLVRPETTRSLAYRILDIDIGYSSDEGGDDDCAYFLDGVDNTFTTMKQAQDESSATSGKGETPKSSRSTKAKSQKKEEPTEKTFPVKRNDFSGLGESGKICAAVTLTDREPDGDDFDNFPFPSSKEIEAKKIAAAEAEQQGEENQQGNNGRASRSPDKVVKRSTVKVEQISTSSNEVIRVWASAEAAAATLQLDVNQIKQMLKGVYDEDLGDEVGGYRWRYAVAGAEVTATAGQTTRGSKKGKEAYLEFREKLYDHEVPHHYKNGNKLRDYQIDGVNWLASTWYKRHSCILADEMGLGKTVQIVAYIEHLYRVEKIHRPYLVVVPLSTVEHWRREFQGWTDMVCCVYHDRQRVWRDVMREYEWYYADRPHTPDYLKFDVLVTTYDTLIGDFDIIGQIPWRVAVVDEAHRLRNVKGKLLECMKEISARGTLQYGFQSRILMTGTPLQNNTQELWTLLNFIEPYKFPSLEEFQTNFGNMANREQVEALQQKISPYMLRRVKEDVAKDIPAKEETVIDVELTSIQKQYYRAIFEHNHSFLSMGATRTNAPKLMNIQMELRKCCNHPFLLDGVEQRESENQFRELLETGKFEGISPEEQQLMLNEHGYIQTSGKMVLLDKLLPYLRKSGHKVLIFSQMVKMLDLISEYCDFRSFNYERLDGRVRGTERQKAIDRFETQEDSFMFLLSTRAGGVGINLTAADICIIFDSDWNPQNDVQAQARCHRIGQTKDVMIYRLVTSRTFEQEMFDRASKKLGLEQAVLGTFGQENDDDKPTSKEMEQLLKKGAYALLEDENDETGKKFCSDDIESILAQRTRTRVVEGAKTATWLNKQGMVVSKSRFTGDSAAATADVDVDDPLFWQKVMPDFVTPEIMMTKLRELSEQIEGGGSGRGRKKASSKAEKSPQGDSEQTKNSAGEKVTEAEQEDAQPEASTGDTEDENGGEAKEGTDAEEGAEGLENAKEDDDDDSGEEKENKKSAPLSRTNQRKVHKFMSDLKSMMDGIFEEAEDDSLPQSEKETCQKLLLTISVKEWLFNEEQRHTARVMLKRLEGDRRRRCRTGTEKPPRPSQGTANQEDTSAVREELLILSKHQRRKRRQKEKSGEEPDRKRKKRNSDDEKSGRGYLGEDGYLHHSDSEADWSDIGEDIYKSKKRAGISKKEAKRRRTWASDKDAASAAGRPWPAFPRSVVSKVLTSLLEEVIAYDTAKGGQFSAPVSRDEYPEYYEQIKQPMDYSTMKEKLERGEYRSAQAMQKDFVLVMSNCIQFNSSDSDIVKEARQQALMRPTVLKNAAMKNNLFLAEDGSVLEVYSDGEGDKEDGDSKGKTKKRSRRGKETEENSAGTKRAVRCKKCEGCRRSEDCGECVACADKPEFGGNGMLGQECELRQCTNPKKRSSSRSAKKRKQKKKSDGQDDSADDESGRVGDEEDGADDDSLKKKPRIRISLGASTPRGKEKKKEGQEDGAKSKKRGKRKKSSAPPNDVGSGGEGDKDDDQRIPRLKRKRRRVEKEDNGMEETREENPTGRKKRARKKSRSTHEDAEEKPNVFEDSDSRKTKEVEDQNGKDVKENANSSADVWLDVDLHKKEREGLDGTPEAVRANFAKHGPWQLPASVDNSRFKDVATQTLNKISRHDRYSVFAEAVTEKEAPGYYDVIKSPMDFSKMRKKIDKGDYGTGPDAVAGLYQDFLLVLDNCLLFNEDGGEVEEEACRVYGFVPETFAGACSAAASARKNPKSRRRGT